MFLPTRFPLRLPSSLAVRGALGGGSGPPGTRPAPPPERRSAGEAPGRGQPVHPGLPRPGHVEEGAARRHSPTQGLSAGSLLGQERQAGPGQGAAAEAGCDHRAGLTEIKKMEEVLLILVRACELAAVLCLVHKGAALDCEILFCRPYFTERYE